MAPPSKAREAARERGFIFSHRSPGQSPGHGARRVLAGALFALRPDREGTYVIELVVSGEGRSSAPDTVLVQALPVAGARAPGGAKAPVR